MNSQPSKKKTVIFKQPMNNEYVAEEVNSKTTAIFINKQISHSGMQYETVFCSTDAENPNQTHENHVYQFG